MHSHLLTFISAHAIRTPTGFYELAQFCQDFYDFLPPAARDSWRRSRVVAALTQAGFVVGVHHRVVMVGGLAPRGRLVETDGRLELVSNG